MSELPPKARVRDIVIANLFFSFSRFSFSLLPLPFLFLFFLPFGRREKEEGVFSSLVFLSFSYLRPRKCTEKEQESLKIRKMKRKRKEEETKEKTLKEKRKTLFLQGLILFQAIVVECPAKTNFCQVGKSVCAVTQYLTLHPYYTTRHIMCPDLFHHLSCSMLVIGRAS